MCLVNIRDVSRMNISILVGKWLGLNRYIFKNIGSNLTTNKIQNLLYIYYR